MNTPSPKSLLARKFTAGALVLSLGATSMLTGCNNAGEGALTGAGLGALGGMAIGSAFGKMGKGAAIGAAAGAVGGAVVGDQNQRSGRQIDYSRGW